MPHHGACEAYTTHLPTLRIFLAKCDERGRDVSTIAERFARLIAYHMAHTFGGCQTRTVDSLWLNPDTGQLVAAQTIVVECLAERTAVTTAANKLAKLIGDYADKAYQRSILVEYDGRQVWGTY